MGNWATPQHSRGKINQAGRKLSQDDFVSDGDRETSLEIINNWRSSHAYPLQALKMTLLGRAHRADPKSIVAQRLKRLTSIRAKLIRFPRMELTQMQDIGGCRAVVGSIRSLHKLIDLYRQSIAKNPKGRSECVEEYAYLATPKSDGYRGHHLVYKYRTKPGSKSGPYEGLRIEIQLRSRLQHAWATAVETVDTFTNQALKSGFGKPGWKRFFALIGSALARRERTTLVPETPANTHDLIEELRLREKELNAITVLESLGVAVQHVSSREGLLEQVDAFLLELNVGTRTIKVTGFPKATMEQAAEAYLESEKRASSDPAIQSVLVSVESLAQLQSAYPNYYLDTREFVAAVRTAIQ